MREAFAAMPDSLMPTLTKNNRLDLMDFMDANMRAAVTNRLGGETLMTFLSADSLSVKVSAALTVDMKMAQADTAAVVRVKRTYTTATGEHAAVTATYGAPSWTLLEPARTTETTLYRLDEKVNPAQDNK